MALSVRLDLKQSQSLVMTPQLQQAIKLLQMSNVELTAFVEEEMERNPMLQADEGEGPAIIEAVGPDALPAEDTQPASPTPEDADGPAGLNDMDLSNDNPASENNDAIDADIDNLWTSNSSAESQATPEGPSLAAPGSASRSGSFDDQLSSLENTLSEDLSLRDHLNAQINMDFNDADNRLVAAAMIEHLDESGYFIGDVQDIADNFGTTDVHVENILDCLQHLDPPGIFARSLSECLAIQLRDKDRLDPAMASLLDNLELLGKRDFKTLMDLCGVDQEDLVDMMAEIRLLDPKPALKFDEATAQPVSPDVIMRPGLKNGGWILELNAETLPRVLLDNQYYAEVSAAGLDKEAKKYVTECYQTANWLVKSLHQRATTILKVSSEIVRQQDGFFKHGIQALRPLVLRDIADAIEMHESTVSRVTSNKYIATPRGIFELKYFFSSSLGSTAGGDAHSAEAVRHRIKSLIDAEDPKKILSDDKIVVMLRDDGIDIARRTVAKYREAMGISSSVQRRREKKAQLGMV